jgi:hypothetical protein
MFRIEAVQIGLPDKRANADQSTLTNNFCEAAKEVSQLLMVILLGTELAKYPIRLSHFSHVKIGDTVIGQSHRPIDFKVLPAMLAADVAANGPYRTLATVIQPSLD